MTKKDYQVLPIPRLRYTAFDAGYLGRQRHIIHGLVEVDVTIARKFIQEYETRTGEQLSFTAFILNCIGEAVETDKRIHAYRNWRNQLIVFDEVNINTMIEANVRGQVVPLPHIFNAVNQRTYWDLHNEMRATQANPQRTVETRFLYWFLYLPAFLRRLFYKLVLRSPNWFRNYSSSILVTAVGMYGRGSFWGIPTANFTLTITLGGVNPKPVVVEGQIAIREILNMTISVDHDIVDGAPATRFGQRLVELIEGGFGLDAEGFE
jgi:pyruvate/2-oxoglutarate dehydrogenase complex dihydrolipoamide acyltransferase (E2) component